MPVFPLAASPVLSKISSRLKRRDTVQAEGGFFYGWVRIVLINLGQGASYGRGDLNIWV